MRVLIILFLFFPLLLSADEIKSIETDKIKLTLGSFEFGARVQGWYKSYGVDDGGVYKLPVILDVGLKNISQIVIYDLNVINGICMHYPQEPRKAWSRLYSINFLDSQFTGKMMIFIPMPCILGALGVPTKIKFIIHVKTDGKIYHNIMSRNY